MTKASDEDVIDTLQQRFARNMHLHPGVDWATVQRRLESNAGKLKALLEMEQSGGEPDVIGAWGEDGAVVFCDCAAESPRGRRSLCYDDAALQSRKENKPAGSASEVARAMGITLLTEARYHELQALGEFDLKTSSWLATPPDIRQRGGAIFGDRRYDRVFTYHNGAESYYAARGFRGVLTV
ncbi:MAG: DUF4256 domain-containing protein [Polaromonas sp.]|nr:DUF4256 domain-containing protein [Polaromonas sp.]